jgi:hypothetical protein
MQMNRLTPTQEHDFIVAAGSLQKAVQELLEIESFPPQIRIRLNVKQMRIQQLMEQFELREPKAG